jgi:hypothetical protein
MALLAAAGVTTRAVPIQRWSGLLGKPAPVPEHWADQPSASQQPAPGSPQEYRVARSIARASRLLPWTPSCLDQALAAQVLLRRAGTPGLVVIGVRRTDEAAETHAWVMGHAGPLTGGPTGGGFTPTSAFAAPASADPTPTTTP